MTTLPHIEIVESLRVVPCPECGTTYALAMAAFMAARRDQTAIYCPAGHAWTPAAEGAEPSANADQRIIELQAALADTRLKLLAAQARLQDATPAPSGPLPAKELRRRCRILAARADRAKGGSAFSEDKAVCVFCGSALWRGGLATHLRRRHVEEITAKPASYFDVVTDRLLERLGG